MQILRDFKSCVLQLQKTQGLEAEITELQILQGLAGEGRGGRSGCYVFTAYISTVVHALQEEIGRNCEGGKGLAALLKASGEFERGNT